ncbi:OLC1v1010401C1 [Oldenlandia corymbosa var. corymbosa]|uniref:OLC1v1010401C1 n=1 Tax=Oldenlandia corymbosa var. corymbosa TaxID=529605 RepID=A0AAV1DR88_OLDCO|nr:OLC1v1010401C1 [Oldenlandia corymbosa var. corymbosa]
MGFLSARISKELIFFLLCSLFAISAAQKLKTFNKRYGSFDSSDMDVTNGALLKERDAGINNQALQLTPDSLQQGFIKTNKSGRMLLRQRFKLWDGDGDEKIPANDTRRVASFNTSFLINISPVDNATGEGLTFLIAPSLNSTPPSSYGQYLGLTNATTDGQSSNKIVAIELDTFKQPFDPDNNHIGLDINGVNSKKVESLALHNITLAPLDEVRFHNVWVDYDGINKVIDVYIARQQSQNGPTPPKPDLPIITYPLNLRDVLNQYSYFGFSGSTGNTAELNCVLRWNLTVEHFPDEKGHVLTIVLAVVVPALVLILLGAAGLVYYVRRKNMGRSSSNILGALKSLPGSPREFEYKELKRATSNFDEKHKLGQGGYGVVHRGFLPKDNLEIAVKCFLRESIKGEDDFLAELTIINRLRHKHLVKLLDWVWFLHRDGLLLQAVDMRLGEDYIAEEAERLLLLALACSHPIASERPKTQAVLQIITGAVPPPQVPPFKPAFVWPAMLPLDIESSFTDTGSITTSQYNSGWSQQCLSRESHADYTDHSLV